MASRLVVSLSLLAAAAAAVARDPRSTHIVHLCSEDHRAAVAADWPDAHHITNLPSVRALIVHASPAEVAGAVLTSHRPHKTPLLREAMLAAEAAASGANRT